MNTCYTKNDSTTYKAIRTGIFLLICCMMLPALLVAQQSQPPLTDKYAAGKKVITDLSRIVNPKGIQENYKVKIGGIDQSVYVRGQDSDNPVLLFVHGGPASPLSPVMWMFQRPIEEYYTVVTWDQRGAGSTFLNVNPDSISHTIKIDNYVSDALELATYIKQRYQAKKIILMGHSWGTIVAMKAALKRPDLFYAYIGIGQVINVRENEAVSYDFAVAQAKKFGNEKALKELQAIAPYPGNQPVTRERIVTARDWAQYYGGLTAFRHESTYFYNAPYLSPEYSREEVKAIDESNVFTLGRILDEFLEVDFKSVRTFPIPVFMFMGRHDYTTPSEPTAAWLEPLKAPVKKGIWFEKSSHMIPFEEPGKLLIELKACLDPIVQHR
ncbi:alpha/beta fold hydrolase [Chitinophaga nivalis]|uniref:Alpha/beta hydrolase n=1 Tax=Chitinophaga nivalis TaxID=2991709 RepID=A0ABT3IKE7_9BACT|nr:alpha/beta hydrolase [Chitinophaga nivalis]MCW3465869.1 alpha/beta hydrolase [Chitinophaga nivalis]MCW3484440.1 alpha/beta hydrolase [Chitinophaga nivalis]